MFDVYMHTSPSGKRYVGYSGDGMAQRWREHVQETGLGGDRLICRAIRKYSADAFRSEVLAQVSTEAEAKALEIECIAAAGSLAPGGYNATAGGEGITAACPVTRAKLVAAWTPERRVANGARMREQNKGNAHGAANAGSKRTPEARAKMSEKARGHARHNVPHTEETKARISAALRKRFQDLESRAACGNGNRGKPWSAARRAAHESRG